MPSFARETNHPLLLTNTRLNKGLYAALPYCLINQSVSDFQQLTLIRNLWENPGELILNCWWSGGTELYLQQCC